LSHGKWKGWIRARKYSQHYPRTSEYSSCISALRDALTDSQKHYQFVGILPNTILSAIFDSVTPLLTTLLPQSEQVLVNQITVSLISPTSHEAANYRLTTSSLQDSIQSVIASLSGSSVTALEQVSSCYSSAIKSSGNSSTLACFTKPGGAASTLETASKSVLEQFVGVLPASLTTAVENILTYNLANASSTPDQKLAGQVSAQISNAINSVSSALSGNTVTLAETLQACASELIASESSLALCLSPSRRPAKLTLLSIDVVSHSWKRYSRRTMHQTIFCTPNLSNDDAFDRSTIPRLLTFIILYRPRRIFYSLHFKLYFKLSRFDSSSIEFGIGKILQQWY